MKKTYAFLLAALSLFAASHAAEPNILFILVDDMGWTGTSVPMRENDPNSKSDFYQTPHLETLAAQGMVFSNAYAPAALCTPSRAAILTGKTPAELQMTTPGAGRPQSYQKLASAQFVRSLPSSEITLAETLKSKGYSTAHFGKWHLGKASPSEHGFAEHDGATGNDAPANKDGNNPKDIFGITDRAIDFLSRQAKAQSPFYLQLSHYAVHTPFEALSETEAEYRKKSKGKRHSDPSYAAMTQNLDTSIGLLLAKLDELGLRDETYIVLMSDNGAGSNRRIQANTPLQGGKGTFYEGGIRVPLIISGPGIPHAYSQESVSGCDLYPTFAALAGIELEHRIAGTSLTPLLADPTGRLTREQTPFLFHFPHYGKGPLQKPQSALIAGDYKLLKDLETGTLQLFNLKQDLGETKDLSKRQAEKTAELAKRLEQLLRQANAQMPTANRTYDPNAAPPNRNRRN
ncbi:sulfatase [Pelagicoccus sp. SDUM812005]|uniref:sulfatase n=1 Tax=Pelagicoccus sp. SDUM812005 TaxID=3041257 RepID=UPI00280D5C1E|nr:sulfatase [Pelagicoccus sp. SDUM812005]MDQ8182931.1 sulfatase [Pelagicoccus sp. SDUM812005]